MLQQLYSSVLIMEKLSRKYVNTYCANHHSTAQFWRVDVQDRGTWGWVSGEDSLPDLQTVAFSLHPRRGPSGVSFSSCEDTIPIGLGPHRMTSFNLNYFLKGPNFKYYKTGLRVSKYTFGVYFQSITPNFQSISVHNTT